MKAKSSAQTAALKILQRLRAVYVVLSVGGNLTVKVGNMPWTKYDKVIVGNEYGIRDGSGTYACPVCWNINRGYENNYRLYGHEKECPICKVKLEWNNHESHKDLSNV